MGVRKVYSHFVLHEGETVHSNQNKTQKINFLSMKDAFIVLYLSSGGLENSCLHIDVKKKFYLSDFPLAQLVYF